MEVRAFLISRLLCRNRGGCKLLVSIWLGQNHTKTKSVLPPTSLKENA